MRWKLKLALEDLRRDLDRRFELPLLAVMKSGMPKFREGDTCTASLLFEMPRIGRRLLELAPFEPEDVDLGDVVLEPVRVCSFVVRDEHGQPLSAAVARLDDHWLTKPSNPTNREGRGELRLLPEGRARLGRLGPDLCPARGRPVHPGGPRCRRRRPGAA